MSRRRFLYNGDVGSGLTHWQFKIWRDGDLLGEKIVWQEGQSTVIPLSSSNAELIQRLFAETEGFDYQSIERKPSCVDLFVEDEKMGSCILRDFWEDSRWSVVQGMVLQLLDEENFRRYIR